MGEKWYKTQKDPEVFLSFNHSSVGALPRVKYGSQKVHHPNYTTDNGTIISKCRNKNAQFFSYNWYKVDCRRCWREKLDLFMQLWNKPLEELKQKREFKEYAKQLGFKRETDEKFNEFKERVSRIRDEQWKRKEAIREREYLYNLRCTSFITLQLKESKLTFPLTIKELYESEDEYGSDIYGVNEVKVDKKKYIELLTEMKNLIENQLNNLKK